MTRNAPILPTTLLFLAIACAYLVMALRYPLAYIWATYEDLFGEWLQFWCFAATFLLSLRLVTRQGRHRVFFVLLSLSCLYVCLEEISWGQRLFRFESPEFFKTQNLQGETNLHNLLTGPYSTLLKACLAYGLAGGLVAYGVAFPIAVWRGWEAALWLDRRGLAAPPLYLWPFFVTAAYLELSVLSFNEAEVAEILVGQAMVVTALQYAFARAHGVDVHRTADWPPGAPTRLAVEIAGVSGLLIVLAVLTTALVYAQPESKAAIDRRIANGVEKFASRYTRYERWGTAAELYERVHEAKPESRSTLRKLADCYGSLGDAAKRRACLEQALTIDLQKLDQDPAAASVHRSLARTYRMLGQSKDANAYLVKALRIGLDRVKNHPDSGNAAYSLGLTYELMGRHEDAFKQFERACTIDPASKSFRKAYYRARQDVD